MKTVYEEVQNSQWMKASSFTCIRYIIWDRNPVFQGINLNMNERWGMMIVVRSFSLVTKVDKVIF
jgi:hypothetical protein